MTEDTVDLPKGLFGYRREVIEQLVSDRDLMQRQAEGRVRAMEAKVADLERELDETRDELSIRTEQLSELQSEVRGSRSGPGRDAVPNQLPARRADVDPDRRGAGRHPYRGTGPGPRRRAPPRARSGFRPSATGDRGLREVAQRGRSLAQIRPGPYRRGPHQHRGRPRPGAGSPVAARPSGGRHERRPPDVVGAAWATFGGAVRPEARTARHHRAVRGRAGGHSGEILVSSTGPGRNGRPDRLIRHQPRDLHTSTYGRSRPMVVSRPWPGETLVSSGSSNSRSRLRMI